MGEISEELNIKISKVMEEIEESELSFDEKATLQQKVIQAKKCANGSQDKIDEMSKVLLNSTLHQITSEIRLPKKISSAIREELKDTEKNITASVRQAIKDHADECFRRMNEYSANFMPDSNKKICTGCNDTGDGGDTESENVVEMITGKKKKSGFLGWIEDISKQSPLLTAIVILYLFQKYGISWVENLLGLSSK
jgi:Na+-translocating ferredoxin:NAD+ oxidoreductase RNF subunit RnfB